MHVVRPGALWYKPVGHRGGVPTRDGGEDVTDPYHSCQCATDGGPDEQSEPEDCLNDAE